MNFSNNTHIHTDIQVAQDIRHRGGEQKTVADFNTFDIGNHHGDKIVSKKLDFHKKFHFERQEEDGLKGSLLEMNSLHLAKKRHVAHVDKSLLESDDCESDVDDFEEEDDSEWLNTYEVPLKRLSSGGGRIPILGIEEEDKTAIRQDFRKRVQKTLDVDSLHITRERRKECN